MTERDPEYIQRAQAARQHLADQFLGHPDVSLIDLGLDPESQDSQRQIVLRIHLRPSASEESLQIPAEIEGIPVRVLRADFRLE